MSSPPAAHKAGLGCIVLFLLPFASIGAFTMVQGVVHALNGRWSDAAFMGLFGLVFGLVGFGGIFAAFKARRAAVEADAVRARHPEAPWLWRADWAAGKILDGSRSTMVAAWVFAGFWNLVSLPAAVLAVRKAIGEGSYGPLFVLVFPAVGLGLLAWAIAATIRFRRYGVSRLELDTVPAAVGRSLRGTVHAPASLDTREPLQVILTCLRRVTRGSGKNRSTTERILWQEERRVPAVQGRTALGISTRIPVAFALPADSEPCDTTNPRDKVVWRLSVRAEVPGVDYASTFEVPVFRTAKSATAESATAAGGESEDLVEAVAPFVQPPTSRVRVTRNRRGTEIVFPAGRNPLASAGLTLFSVVWLGATWATVYLGAPLLFQLVFGGFGLILVWATMASWLGITQVTVGYREVTVASGLLAPMRRHRLGSDEIAEVTTRIGMQAGSTPYYDLILVRKDGKRMRAGRGIRDKREAEWLAATMREALEE